MNSKFRYYNHALIPNIPNDETLTFTKEELKDAFKEKKKALFLRYTSHFDCGFDSDWYYVIQDEGVSYFEKLSLKHQKNLKRTFKHVYCKEIDYEQFKDRILEIFRKCISKYSNYSKKKKPFNILQATIKIIGCFTKEDDILIGFEIIEASDEYVYLKTEKTDIDYSKYQPSFALNNYIINNYTLSPTFKYITNGERAILHKTNHDNYLILHCGFRKANCQLHIVYRSIWIKISVVILRIVKPLLKIFDNMVIGHQINGLLLMDRIARKQRKVFKNV